MRPPPWLGGGLIASVDWETGNAPGLGRGRPGYL
jgi:hypothetical protein